MMAMEVSEGDAYAIVLAMWRTPYVEVRQTRDGRCESRDIVSGGRGWR
jgi:hypothetical protein